MSIDFGPVQLSREGDILFAENDWLRMAYVATDDQTKIGTDGWHPYKHTEMFVEFISPEMAKRWAEVPP